jgi:hypothetical protein
MPLMSALLDELEKQSRLQLMIPYRFLTPAEEEMTDAALFYEAASSQLESDFLNDVQ